MVPLMALAAAGCGYHFGASGSGLPTQAKTIYVEDFTNRTRFTGINDQLMRYIKDEIADHKRLDLVDAPDQADLVLSGEVMYLDSMAGATNAVGEPIVYQESLTANATLINRRTRRVIWETRGVGASEQVPIVGSSVITTSPKFLQQNLRAQDVGRFPDMQLAETQRTFARGEIMQELAKNLYSSMSEGF